MHCRMSDSTPGLSPLIASGPLPPNNDHQKFLQTSSDLPQVENDWSERGGRERETAPSCAPLVSFTLPKIFLHSKSKTVRTQMW